MKRSRQDVLRLMHYFNQNSSCSAHSRICSHTHHKHTFGTEKSSEKTYDYAFEFKSSQLRFGPGVTSEVGYDLQNFGAKRVCVITDPFIANLPPIEAAVQSLKNVGLEYDVYDGVRVEPTDGSFKDAINFAMKGNFDAFLAVGGGSVIDTAKAANLYSCFPNHEFLDFVNAPVGKGLPVPGPLKPLVAVPTTTGTGSETTGIAIFDMEEMNFKTGIGSRYLTPNLGLIDPDHAMHQPEGVIASTGFDVLCHALESYTAIAYHDRSPRPKTPAFRPTYQGANPISDVWCEVALPMIAKNFFRAVEDPEDREARTNMQYASCFAGMGFGTAGVHLCHGLSYPISGINHNRSFVYRDYENVGHAIIPHGVSVVLTAPAVFDFCCSAKPDRHAKAAIMLGADENTLPSAETSADSVELIANKLRERVLHYMQRLKIPNGLSACGFDSSDIDALVAGAIPQERVTKIAPHPVDPDVLGSLFEKSLSYY